MCSSTTCQERLPVGDQTLASLQRIATVLDDKKAQLWINHDKPQSAGLRFAPAYYE